MITFSRSQLVGVEFFDQDTARFHGIQDDHIYSMEVEMDAVLMNCPLAPAGRERVIASTTDIRFS